MFRFGHTRFQALTTMNDSGNMISFLQTTNLPLSNADANSATATLLLGKMVDYAAADETQMRLGTGFAVGILGQSINLNGTTDDLGFKKLTVGGFPDIPAKRGLAVGIFCPFPGFEAIFEGAADISGGNGPAIDHLVVKTGTGALGGGTSDLTPLSVVNGAWRAAQSGDYVLANFRQNLTPKNAGEIRIRVRFCSPWKLP
jgi:hypothetical protein